MRGFNHMAATKLLQHTDSPPPAQTNYLITTPHRQTLGGSGPLKGGLAKVQINKALLKKMKGYGGKMFHDK